MSTSRFLLLAMIFGLLFSACAPAAVTPVPELTPAGTDVPSNPQLPPPGETQPTDVKLILALQDVPIYGGQEVQYGVIGNVAAGQMAGVTGISADGKWWQVGCPGDSVDGCWVTADPGYTEPTEPPG